MAVSSANSSKSKNKDAGFTLVEVLCVLALLGLTAGLVVVNLPKPPPPLQSDMQRLTTLLNLAARQSVIDGKTRGVDFTTQQLEIFEYDGAWVLEHQHDLADVYGIDLQVEDQEIDLKIREKKKEDSDLPPIIHFDAVGNVTSFSLSISGLTQSFTLAPNERGRIAMEAMQ